LSIILYSKKKSLEPVSAPVLGQSADCFNAQAVGHWPFTTMAWIQFQANPCAFCGGQHGIQTGSQYISFTLSVSSTNAPHSHSFIYH